MRALFWIGFLFMFIYCIITYNIVGLIISSTAIIIQVIISATEVIIKQIKILQRIP
jgi:hypothetical protein